MVAIIEANPFARVGERFSFSPIFSIKLKSDEDISSGERNDNQRSDTVIITGEGRAQTGLVRQVISPEYLGALIVCQGASDAKVRLWVVDAVMRVTGLTSDKITVLKMK